MFKTIGNTIDLIKASWRVLQDDRKLLILPAMSVGAILLLFAVAAGVFGVIGTFDTATSEEESFTATEYAVAALFYFLTTFTVVYFNSALVSVAHVKLSGGSASVRDGLRAANERLPFIFGWACFATTIGLIIDTIRNSDNGVLKVVGWVLSSVWAYTTFLVVPVLVIEGVSPIQALKRSTQLFQGTWGKQVVANFGFGLAYVVLFVVAFTPLIIVSASATALLVVLFAVSLPILLGGLVVLSAMDGIFKAGLYQFATTGESSGYFSGDVLRRAYVSKDDRGSWGSSNRAGSVNSGFDLPGSTRDSGYGPRDQFPRL